MRFPKKLQDKLEKRVEINALRSLNAQSDKVDFSSNDYLGIAKSEAVFNASHQYLIENDLLINGATGSRLLSGNHTLYDKLEKELCEFHNTEASIVFNSGYDANVGFFSSVPQRGDIILYDEFAHASIRDGIKMSDAKSYKFKHNNIEDLQKLLARHAELVSEFQQEVFVVTESVFSMDGDAPDIVAFSALVKKYEAYLVVDEAHAVGVVGDQGKGVIQNLKKEDAVFARIITFGKALGCHGAAILGDKKLKEYLVNFSRSFMYTTGLSPHAVSTIHSAYDYLKSSNGIQEMDILRENIHFFKKEIQRLRLQDFFIASNSSIHCCIISGNEKVKSIALELQEKGFDVKPILSPTVPKEEERLRFCLHSYNSKEEIKKVLEMLAIFVAA
jgi:8-amino-7-oxononanoate synthase